MYLMVSAFKEKTYWKPKKQIKHLSLLSKNFLPQAQIIHVYKLLANSEWHTSENWPLIIANK